MERSGHLQFGHSLPTNLAKPQAWKVIKWTIIIQLSGVLKGGYIGDYMGVFIKGIPGGWALAQRDKTMTIQTHNGESVSMGVVV